MEEFVKYTILMRPHFELFGDRFSERQERAQKAIKAEEERRKLAKVEDESQVVNGVGIDKM